MSSSDEKFRKKLVVSSSKLLEKIVEDLLHQKNVKEVEKIILENLKNLQLELDQFYGILFELYQKGNSLSDCHLEIEHFKDNLEHCLGIIKKIVLDYKQS